MFYELLTILKWLSLEIYCYMGRVSILEIGYLSLLERQVVAVIQQRVGPSFTGGLGALLQPLADGFKLLIKEIILPSKSRLFLFLLAPVYTITFTIALWAGVPISSNPSALVINKEFGVLLLLVTLLLANYGPIVGGWASNNKYALIGAYRAIALSGSYGITIGLVLLMPLLASQSFNIFEIVHYQKEV
jgi:NADH-quinone oxidoreductase subunit H